MNQSSLSLANNEISFYQQQGAKMKQEFSDLVKKDGENKQAIMQLSA